MQCPYIWEKKKKKKTEMKNKKHVPISFFTHSLDKKVKAKFIYVLKRVFLVTDEENAFLESVKQKKRYRI